MTINFNLNDLQAFRAVAELNSFRKAAASLHVSQPAFSRRIEKLEEALGVRLLERTTRRVSLTAVGREFDRKVKELLDDLDQTLLGIRGVTTTRMGEVTIACVPSTVYYFLSQVISRYHAQYPKIRVKILDASANEVLTAVSRSEADFGLNFVGGQEADIEFSPLLEERFVAACRRDHPLAKRRQVTWADLAGYDYISVSKASGNRLLLDQALSNVQGLPQSIYETQHVTTTLGLVEAGLGIAAVPSIAMPGPDHPLLVSVPLTDPVVTRKIGLIRRKSRALTPAAQQLYDFLSEIRAVRTKGAGRRRGR
ncbi:LysR family transcriptional regulator [Cupriavidus taiwanensis]|uniref:Putative DNA-binding transcriptional regulator n=1 Tax=Cupriavidus taiwanensis TaxID=164546 RepID=A0A375ICY7_9BURK|nr:LysR family transcriptional regulator [Cupriavidus taiwanensis]SOY42811.1 putative DNA-binding transcriptional regulator [Cupriavidus taiwanensis]SOY58914.1 putative DNA-binding transcriptional regulator [Cupriavidus taiwanensis]SOY80147.1 putative DNA-binding transcriptional regulator [Cupriavidus taiwanensis]SOZ33434.1 putative DNA-binding transcriptional regulator [Cupriavidus taiwanensis]SOZ50980.1 putative DNA-binding transcriptional regulator [Cupriavidus taiwanensis]